LAPLHPRSDCRLERRLADLLERRIVERGVDVELRLEPEARPALPAAAEDTRVDPGLVGELDDLGTLDVDDSDAPVVARGVASFGQRAAAEQREPLGGRAAAREHLGVARRDLHARFYDEAAIRAERARALQL